MHERMTTPLPTPRFFVSVASTGLRFFVSRLFAALARGSASVASKRFTDGDCSREGNWWGWTETGGGRRTARGEGMRGWHPPPPRLRRAEGSVPEQRSHYSRSVPIVK